MMLLRRSKQYVVQLWQDNYIVLCLNFLIQREKRRCEALATRKKSEVQEYISIDDSDTIVVQSVSQFETCLSMCVGAIDLYCLH
jgi:hypothetical protein